MGRPIHTADRIGRFFVGIRKHISGSLEYRPVMINGHSGVITFCDGHMIDATSVGIVDGRVSSIYIIRNPDKLRHLLRSLTRG